jgi:hypothetical protein
MNGLCSTSACSLNDTWTTLYDGKTRFLRAFTTKGYKNMPIPFVMRLSRSAGRILIKFNTGWFENPLLPTIKQKKGRTTGSDVRIEIESYINGVLFTKY